MALPTPEEIDAMMAAESGASSPISNPISSLPAPEEVDAMMAAERPKLSTNEARVGMLSNFLNGLGFNQADELIGAGVGAIDYGKDKIASLFGAQDPGLSLQDYAQHRMLESEQRRAQTKEEYPVGGYGSEFAGMALNPLNYIKALKGLGTLGTISQSGLTQAISGGLYGFGENQDRLKNASLGTVLGGTLAPAADLFSMGVKGAANLVDDIGTKFKLSSVGITKADTKNAGKAVANTLGNVSKENPLVTSFKEFEKSGGLRQGLSPEDLLGSAKTQQQAKDLAVKTIVSDADTLAMPFSNTPITTELKPNFDSTLEYIKKNFDGDDYQKAMRVFNKETRALEKTVIEGKGGTLEAWQQAKVNLGKRNKYGTDTAELSNEIRKKLTSDIRQHIEDSSDLLLGQGTGKVVKELNKESGQRQSLAKIFKRNKDSGAAGDPLQAAMSVINQFRVPVVLGGIEGFRTGDSGSALTAATLGLAASTKTGKLNLGRLFQGAAKPLAATSSVINAIPKGAIAGMYSRADTLPDPSPQPTFTLPTQGPTVMPKADDIDLNAVPKKKADRIAFIESQIDSDPIDAAIYEIESGRNPLAKNPTSSASGAFQLINRTAKKLGVEDPFDIAQNYKGYLKLKEEHQGVLRKLGIDENDPEALYSLHYLGSPTFKKLFKGQPLTEQQAEQVRFLESKVLPKFRKVYQSKLVNV
jgi:hypothetical protein